MTAQVHRLKNRQQSTELISGTDYDIIVTRNPSLVEQAQRLRHHIFTTEPAYGLPPHPTGRDFDLYDSVCDHLLVTHRESGDVVGCYRMLPPDRVRQVGRRYTDTEFVLSGVEAIDATLVETGRACVREDHRNGAVLSMMWSAIFRYVWLGGHTHLMGCVSIPMADPDGGRGQTLVKVLNELGRFHCDPTRFDAQPRNTVTEIDVEAAFVGDVKPQSCCKLVVPPLLQGYLRLGAKTVGRPAYDPEFDVADIVVLVALNELNERYLNRLAKASGLADQLPQFS